MDLLFSSLSVKRLSYLILVAFTVYWVKSGSSNPEVYWLIWTAFLLSMITTGDSFKRRLNMIVITGLAAGFVSFFIGSLSASPLLVTLILSDNCHLCFNRRAAPAYFMQSFIVVVLPFFPDTLPSPQQIWIDLSLFV